MDYWYVIIKNRNCDIPSLSLCAE